MAEDDRSKVGELAPRKRLSRVEQSLKTKLILDRRMIRDES